MIGYNGVLRFRGKVCVPDDAEFKSFILEEAHKNHLIIHPYMTKMYQNLKESF